MPFGGLLTVGLIGGGAQAIAAWLGSRAAGQASDAQAVAAAYAADLQRQAEREALLLQLGIYEQTREDQMPWLQAGRGGLSRLAQLLGIDTYSPVPRAATRAQPGIAGYTPTPYMPGWAPPGWVRTPGAAPPGPPPDPTLPGDQDIPIKEPGGPKVPLTESLGRREGAVQTSAANDQAVDLVNRAEPYFQQNLQDFRSGKISAQEAAGNFDRLWSWLTSQDMLGGLGEEGAAAIADRAPGGTHDWSQYYRQPLGVDAGGTLNPGGMEDVSYTTDPRGTDFGELLTGFEAPAPFKYDASRLTDDPGYLFRLKEGQQAVERSAAARGGALGGGALRALTDYGQGMASQEYQNAYGRAANEYDRNFQNRFNVFQTNQTNKFNRLASLAGIGQTAATTLSGAGQNYGNQAGNIIMQTGQNVGDLQTQIGNARASGYVGGANAWGGALGNIAQMGTDLYGLNRRYR